EEVLLRAAVRREAHEELVERRIQSTEIAGKDRLAIFHPAISGERSEIEVGCRIHDQATSAMSDKNVSHTALMSRNDEPLMRLKSTGEPRRLSRKRMRSVMWSDEITRCSMSGVSSRSSSGLIFPLVEITHSRSWAL